MPRAISIHIGVNQPQGSTRYDGYEGYETVKHSEDSAWNMAELAKRCGYQSIVVLRGETATRQAVHLALSSASQVLQSGDMLFVSFSGHGGQEPDTNEGGREKKDESWRLYDGPLVDDALAGYWRDFEPGVRIVVVVESCFSGGGDRGRCGTSGYPDYEEEEEAQYKRNGRSSVSSLERQSMPGMDDGKPCIQGPRRDALTIRASVLMLTASAENEKAEDGLFTRCLLKAWSQGFNRSYCELYWKVRELVLDERRCQEPQIIALGAEDLDPLAPPFRPEWLVNATRGG